MMLLEVLWVSIAVERLLPNQLPGLTRDSRHALQLVSTKVLTRRPVTKPRISTAFVFRLSDLPDPDELEKILSDGLGAHSDWTLRCLDPTCLTNPSKGTGHVASQAFEAIVEDFEFLEDWEDRYRYVIDQGRAMAALDAVLKVPATKVDGCASQVWLHPQIEAGVFRFEGESDAMIVRGLIAVLRALYNDLAVQDVVDVDAAGELARLGLNDHLSAQRSNGLRAMIERIRTVAADAA